MSKHGRQLDMGGSTDEEEEVEGVLFKLIDIAQKPFNIALSKTAQRAYISTALFLFAAFSLVGVAAAAYIIFYYSYVPNRGFTIPVYLHFDHANIHHPRGTVQLGHELVSAQPYDVYVLLDLPRTPNNQAAGNFMLDLKLLPPGVGAVGAAIAEAGIGDPVSQALAHAQRPAILTYHSSIIEHVFNIVRFPSYLVGWRREAESLRVDMMDGVEFARGWRNVPTAARLELHSDTKLQVYDVKLVFTARFRGLRYLMYNHRIICFILFTATFWTVEVLSALTGWIILSQFVFAKPGDKQIKNQHLTDSEAPIIKAELTNEEAATEGLSDTSRTFPTFSKQPPLQYSSPKPESEPDTKVNLADVPPADQEADDEDEDADFILEEPTPMRGIHSDSGIGTSMDSSANKRETVRRRKSGGYGSDKRT